MRRAADDERAVVARPVAVVHVDDVEVRLVAGADQPVGEHVRVRAAALAGDRVDRLDELRAHLEQPLVRERDDVALTDAGLQELVDVLIDAVDHRARLRQQDELVGVLDLAREHHHLLPVADVDPRALQLEEHGGLGQVDAERHVADPVLLQHGADLLGRALLEADRRRDGSLQAGVAADRVRHVVELRELQTMRLRGRTEVPDPRRPGAGDQRVALTLVERPVADVGAGRVADVARLEQQHRAQVGGLELFLHPREPVAAQAVEVHTVLPVDAMESGSRAGRDREVVRRHLAPSRVQCRSTNGKPSLTDRVRPHDSRARPDCTTRGRGRARMSGRSGPGRVFEERRGERNDELDRAHPVVAGVVLDLGQPERLHHRRHVHPEPTAQPLLESVPPADRVLGRASPGLHGAVGGRLLLVGAAQRHPIPVLREHRVQVVQAAEVVAELGLADLDDERRWIQRRVAERRELGAPRRCLQHPRVLARAVPLHAVSHHRLLSDPHAQASEPSHASTNRGSRPSQPARFRSLRSLPLAPRRSHPLWTIRTVVPRSEPENVISTRVASSRSCRRCQRYAKRSGGSHASDLAPVVLVAGRGPFEDPAAHPWLERHDQAGIGRDRMAGRPPPRRVEGPRVERVLRRARDVEHQLERLHQRRPRSPGVGVLRGEPEPDGRIAPHLHQVRADGVDPLVVQPVQPARPLGTIGHEPRLLQHAQVSRDRGAADRELVGELPDRPISRPEQLDERTPVGIAERIERIAGERVQRHRRMVTG